MREISAADATRDLAALLDAVQIEPIVIRRQERDIAIVLSPQDYERLRGANVTAFQRFCDRIAEGAAARGLTDEKLTALLADGA